MSWVALQKSVAASEKPAAAAVSGAENNSSVIQEGAQDTPEADTGVDAEKYNFTLNDSEGNPHSLTDYIGKPLLLNFFGTWCRYCNMELPDLQKAADEGSVEVVLIAAPHLGQQWEGDIAFVEQYMNDPGYHFTILYDRDYVRSHTDLWHLRVPHYLCHEKRRFFPRLYAGYMSDDVLEQVVAELTSEEQ